MLEVEPPAYCIFRVVHGSQLSARELERLLVAIPDVCREWRRFERR